MPLLRPVHLPGHLIPQTITIIGLGLYITIFRHPPFFASTGKQFLVPATTSSRTRDTLSLLGILTVSVQLPYYYSSYMPMEENQWLYTTVPVRLGISAMMGLTLLAHGRAGMSEEGFWEFVGLTVLDGIGATLLGFSLGRFDGMVPGYKRWVK